MDHRNTHFTRPNPSDTWGGINDSENDKKTPNPPTNKPKRSIDEHPAIKAARERAMKKESKTSMPRIPAPESPKTSEAKKEIPWNDAVSIALDLVPDATVTRFLTSLAEDRGRTTGIAADVFKEVSRKYGADKVGKIGKERFAEVLVSMPGKRKELLALLDRLSIMR